MPRARKAKKPVESVLELPDGLHPNIAAAVYHRRELGVASKSVLDHVRRSAAHYKAFIERELDDEESAALAFGSAFHCALLEPKVFAATYVVEPNHGDCRNPENRVRRDEWRAGAVGKTCIGAGDMKAIERMIASVRRHPLAPKMLVGGEAEITARWTDRETGIICKARADYYVPARRLVVDVKTTSDGRARAFERSCANFGYARQDAFYRDGFAALGADVDHFVFIAVEKTPPYLVSLFTLDGEAQRSGRASIREDLRTLAECIERDTWPGYPENIQTISLPPWAV